MAKDVTIKVGVLSDGKLHDDDKIGAAGLAAVHEFGSPSRNIPERSFLRLTASQRTDDYKKWIKANKEDISKSIIAGGLSSFCQKIGAFWVSCIHDTFFRSGYGSWPKLKPSTVKARTKGKGRGPAKPLIDTGALMNSITYEVTEE